MPWNSKAMPPMCWGGLAARVAARGVLCSLAVCLALFWGAGQGECAVRLGDVKATLEKEQARAQQRKESLERLTTEERTLDKGLAAAEARILAIEEGLENYQKKLEDLVVHDETERVAYEQLLLEKEKTEKALKETAHFLWELTGRHISTGGRELYDWARMDREHAWSVALFSALEQHRTLLDKQEEDLAQALGRRKKISDEVAENLQAAELEKAKLLQARVRYGQQLDSLREKRVDAEEELATTMKLIESLHFQVKTYETDLKTLKGRIPWPVNGRVEKAFTPGSTPPYRGVGLRTVEGEPVKAVAAGTVVHNDILRGFGRVVVLQHGQEYYSLYAFLQESPMEVGTSITAGTQVGKAGMYPVVEGPGIYFELRFHQKAINPQEWLVQR
ncbi:murein hydrolase activator EnvC family protein [Desulfovibrio cuneatus]|uniref:murein hydrolase activator EnvC family protein n=1 Tax=Desulfovibrio cuneatus TaxID=159728 RepID=UPI000683DD90|nr:peptidoglycan DD-metalloendopeptidase family protein [Desulfovibrio cuneatus]